MDQQDTGARDHPPGAIPTAQPPAPPKARPDADETWGVGASTALDRLRERNYRGKRAVDGKPASD